MYRFRFNPNDPSQMMNGLKPIPINTQEKFDAVLVLARGEYERDGGLAWDDDMDQQTEKRVLDGLTVERILAETRNDRGRKTNTPGA